MTVRMIPGTAAIRLSLAGVAVAMLAAAGCNQREPVQRTPVPAPDNPDARRVQHDPIRPLPADAYDDPMVGHPEDAPLLDVPPPEAGPFVQAYNAVGRPKIVVFVNRTLEGEVMPTTEERIISGRREVVEAEGSIDIRQRETRGGVRERGGYRGGSYSESRTDREGSFTTTGPARVERRSEIYLPPSEYDELWAKRVDYEALENALADAMAVRGEVSVLSPRLVRQRLSPEEVAALEAGRPAVLDDLAERLGADVLVHVQALPTAQTDRGLDLRIVAEALNTADAASVGRANADLHPPMSAARLDAVSRYLARRLMDDMTGAWVVPADEPPPAETPEPTEDENPPADPPEDTAPPSDPPVDPPDEDN